jgi:hypothetical protein
MSWSLVLYKSGHADIRHFETAKEVRKHETILQHRRVTSQDVLGRHVSRLKSASMLAVVLATTSAPRIVAVVIQHLVSADIQTLHLASERE